MRPLLSSPPTKGTLRHARRALACGARVALLLTLALAAAAAETLPADSAAVAESLARQTEILATGSLPLQQRALRRLAQNPGPEATRLIAGQLDLLESNHLPLGLWLEVLEAAAQRHDPALDERLARRSQALARSADPLKAWRECLEGGDRHEGRDLFRTRVEAGCIRCHRAEGAGGEIGPDLSALGQRAQRISVLESILLPNAYLVPGFKSVLLKLRNGDELTGILSFESSEILRLTSITDGHPTTIRASEVVEETPLPSAMPEGYGLILGRRAIRDLVEYLFTQEP